MLNFHEIYVEHAPHVYRFALFLTRDNMLADDLTSDTFVRFWTASDRVEGQSLRSYLLTITRNLHRDHLRKTGRQVELQESPAADARLSEAMDARAQLARVLHALGSLGALDRAVLMERAWEGHSYSDIALRHGISVGSVKVKVFRARARLMLVR